MDLSTALQINALAAVLDPDSDAEYRMRYIFRWYSKTFHTPLHLVEDLPLDDVLTNYYESQYEDLVEKAKDDQILLKEIRNLTESDSERLDRLLRKSADQLIEEKLHRMVMAEEQDKARREKLAAARKRDEVKSKGIDSRSVTPQSRPLIPPPFEKEEAFPPDLSFSKPLGTSVAIPAPEPEVKMRYLSAEDFERRANSDPVVQPPKRR